MAWYIIGSKKRRIYNYIYLNATKLLYLCYKKIWIESNFLKTKYIYKVWNFNKTNGIAVKYILHQMIQWYQNWCLSLTNIIHSLMRNLINCFWNFIKKTSWWIANLSSFIQKNFYQAMKNPVQIINPKQWNLKKIITLFLYSMFKLKNNLYVLFVVGKNDELSTSVKHFSRCNLRLMIYKRFYESFHCK